MFKDQKNADKAIEAGYPVEIKICGFGLHGDITSTVNGDTWTFPFRQWQYVSTFKQVHQAHIAQLKKLFNRWPFAYMRIKAVAVDWDGSLIDYSLPADILQQRTEQELSRRMNAW